MSMKKIPKKGSIGEKVPSSSSFSIETEEKKILRPYTPQKIQISYFLYLLHHLQRGNKKAAMQLIKKKGRQMCAVEKWVEKLEKWMNSWKEKQIRKALWRLQMNNKKIQYKFRAYYLLQNSVKRIIQRNKSQFFSLTKVNTLKSLRGQKNSMVTENQKYRQNLFSDKLIKEIKKLSKLNPLYNINPFLQSVEQVILPLICQELAVIQSRRRKRNQQSDSELILTLISSLCSCLVNANKVNKNMSQELKGTKESLLPLKEMWSIMEHFDKMDKELLNKGGNQLKKIVELQIKVCEKRKSVHRLYDSRYNLLQLPSRFLNPVQKQEMQKQSSKDSPINTSRKSLTPRVSKKDSFPQPVQKRKKTESRVSAKENPEQTIFLNEVLEKIMEGKQIDIEKDTKWKKLMENKTHQNEIQNLYNKIGKVLYLIEAKDQPHQITQLDNSIKQQDEINLINEDDEEWQQMREKSKQKKKTVVQIQNKEPMTERTSLYSSSRLNVEEVVAEYKEEIKKLNQFLEVQEEKIISLEGQNVELKKKDKEVMDLQRVVEADQERIRDLQLQVDHFRNRDQQNQKKFLQAKEEFKKFKKSFKIHQEEFKVKQKEVSLIMKSPKNATFSKSNFFAKKAELHFDERLEARKQEMIKDEKSEMERSLSIEGMMKLVYEIIVKGFEIEERKECDLRDKLCELKRSLQNGKEREVYVQIQKSILEWINANIRKENFTNLLKGENQPQFQSDNFTISQQ